MDMTSPRLDTSESGELEIEIKLTASPKSLAKLQSMLSKASGVERGSKKTARVVSTYFDTEDRKFRKRGLTLRIRQKSGKRVQTVKSEGSSNAGMFARTEWTTPLAGKTPDLSAITAPEVQSQIGLILQEDLVPLFKTDVKRTTLRIQHTCAPGDSATVELAFDQGKIVADKKIDTISEVELELIQGTTTALLDLAKTLSEHIPAVLTLGSKVSRGFDLCDGTYPCASFAGKISLTKRQSIDEAMVHILRPSLDQLLANRNAAVTGRDIEGVHQARVAIRRILSALTVFRKYVAGPEAQHIKAEMRWLINGLGEARDLDVFIDEVIAAVITDRPNDKDLKAVLRTAKKMRTAAYRRVRKAFSSRRYTAAMLELSLWIEKRAWRNTVTQQKLDSPIKNVAPKLLAKRHRKVLAVGENFENLSPESRHDGRIALKKVRYASEFFAGLYPANRTRTYVASLRQLQTALGRSNDVTMAETLANSIVQQARRGSKDTDTLRMGAGKLLGWHTRAAAQADTDLEALWTTFAKSRPFWLIS